jgi:hypothetical protein
MRVNARSSNAVTGYTIRVTEELITKGKTAPININEISNYISEFVNRYSTEHVVKYISENMPNQMLKDRILFIFYLQDDNKHMRYFLNEPLLTKWFDTIYQTNANDTFQRYLNYIKPKENMLFEEVLNDIVFGYCVKLSESLYPLDPN